MPPMIFAILLLALVAWALYTQYSSFKTASKCAAGW